MPPRGIDCFPINLSKRGILGKPLNQVGICNIGTAERHQICQTFCDKAITAITVHLHVRNQCAFVERAEIPEHAIVSQPLQWGAGKIGSVSHEQQVRKVVVVQPPDDILGNRQGLFVGCERATLVHWTDLDSDPACIDLIKDCLNHFEEESGAVLQASAILIFT